MKRNKKKFHKICVEWKIAKSPAARINIHGLAGWKGRRQQLRGEIFFPQILRDSSSKEPPTVLGAQGFTMKIEAKMTQNEKKIC